MYSVRFFLAVLVIGFERGKGNAVSYGWRLPGTFRGGEKIPEIQHSDVFGIHSSTCHFSKASNFEFSGWN